MEKILLILVPGYTYLYIIVFENTHMRHGITKWDICRNFFNIEIHTYSYSRICHLQFKQINLTLCHSPVKLEQFRYSKVGI